MKRPPTDAELVVQLRNRVQQLSDQLQDANETIRQLRSAVEDDVLVPDLMGRAGLTPHEARLAVALMRRGKMSRNAIMSLLYSDRINEIPEPKIVDVFMSKLRRKMPGLEIKVVWGWGYEMAPASRDRLRELTGAAVTPNVG